MKKYLLAEVLFCSVAGAIAFLIFGGIFYLAGKYIVSPLLHWSNLQTLAGAAAASFGLIVSTCLMFAVSPNWEVAFGNRGKFSLMIAAICWLLIPYLIK